MTMADHNGSADSFNSINDIYARYAAGTDSYAHSLDLNDNSPGLNSSPHDNYSQPHASHFIPHLLTHNTINNDEIRSAPGTPLLVGSFDFGLAVEPRAITSSSLNVLLDTPSTESQLKQLGIKSGRSRITDLADSSEYVNHDEDIDDVESYAQHSEFVNGESMEDIGDDDAIEDEEAIDDVEEAVEDVDEAIDEDEAIEEDSHSSEPSEDQSREDWVNKGAAERRLSDSMVIRRTVKDFEFGKDLGEGSYSTVVLATDKITTKQYAVKVLDKRHIIKEKKVKYVNIEKHALNRLSNCNGIISLFFTFQDKFSLYFVLDYASNGELLNLIKTYGSLNEECTRHLGAQILDAMKNMHDNGVVHRDIKPENILLDDKFRIKITDFGTAKLLEKRKSGDSTVEEYPVDVRAKSFVGTAEYVSPELLDSKYCGKPGDIWAFGCILYQMVAGKPPFKATNEYLTFQKITKLQYAFSAGFPLILRDLIKQILVLQPSRRATIKQIQSHYFFREIKFDDLLWSNPLPELGPYKMTAKSMMKMPPQSKAQPTVIKKPAHAKKQTQGSPAPAVSKRVVSDDSGNGFSPASVAAFVLTKHDDEENHHPSTKTPPNNTNGPVRHAPAPEYIPGTNILRPTIHSMASYSRANTQTKQDSDPRRLKSKVLDVAPMSQVELAWEEYLETSTERILNVGLAIVCKQPVEYFERKNRGLVHDAPLGLINKLQAADSRLTGRSLLSKVAHSNKGLRDMPSEPSLPRTDKEEDAVTYYYEEPEGIESIPEDEEKSGGRSGNGGTLSKIGKGFLKKFLSHSDKKAPETVSDVLSVKSSNSGSSRHNNMTLEKARTCHILVTTHGRLLIFTKEDGTNETKLVAEIKLNFPFIHFREVISNNSKFSKVLPSTGIFAVVATQTAFVFEVEKYEVSQWTEALAKAKLNQLERDRIEEAKRKNSPRASPKPSPKLMDAPTFASPSQRVTESGRRSPVRGSSGRGASGNSGSGSGSGRSSPYQLRRTVTSPRTPSVHVLSPTELKERTLNQLFQSKVKSSKTNGKRKPPPPLPKSQSLGASGLSREAMRGDSGTIHAAQLAVSNNPNLVMTEPRSSSFTRENGLSVYKHNVSGGASGSGNGGKAKITTMNSKFLARSRGKK